MVVGGVGGDVVFEALLLLSLGAGLGPGPPPPPSAGIANRLTFTASRTVDCRMLVFFGSPSK